MRRYLKTGFILLGLLCPSLSWGAAKVLMPLSSQVDYRTAQTVAGVNPSGDVTPIQVDALGNLLTVSSGGASSVNPINGKVNIPLSGPADRVQLPSNTVTSCTLQVPFANAGSIYVGGSTVTNASGVNEGIQLNVGDTFGAISVSNSNLLYVATDNAGDDVKFFCN